MQEGTFHHSQVETPYGPPVRLANAGVFRYEPRAQKFGVYVSYGFANPHGHAFDHWGQDIVVDGTGAVPFHGALFSGHVDFPEQASAAADGLQQRTRPCPGIEYLYSRHFPPEMQGNLLVGNVIGFQGILQYKVEDNGASFTATEVEPILSSTDPSFRPADFEIGPDGAIVLHRLAEPDHRPHATQSARSEPRPHARPRLSRDLRGTSADAACQSRRPADSRAARIAQRAGDERFAIAPSSNSAHATATKWWTAVDRWVAGLDENDPQFEHDLLEALWVKQHHNFVDEPLLERVLAAKEFRARAAATRVLCYWRDRVSDPLGSVAQAGGRSGAARAAGSGPRRKLSGRCLKPSKFRSSPPNSPATSISTS